MMVAEEERPTVPKGARRALGGETDTGMGGAMAPPPAAYTFLGKVLTLIPTLAPLSALELEISKVFVTGPEPATTAPNSRTEWEMVSFGPGAKALSGSETTLPLSALTKMLSVNWSEEGAAASGRRKVTSKRTSIPFALGPAGVKDEREKAPLEPEEPEKEPEEEEDGGETRILCAAGARLMAATHAL